MAREVSVNTRFGITVGGLLAVIFSIWSARGSYEKTKQEVIDNANERSNEVRDEMAESVEALRGEIRPVLSEFSGVAADVKRTREDITELRAVQVSLTNLRTFPFGLCHIYKPASTR